MPYHILMLKKFFMIYNIKEEIIIIFEGITEELFLNHLKKIFDSKYKVTLENAESKDRIIKKYKTKRKIYPNNKFFIMFDLDGEDTLNSIKEKFKSEDISLDNTNLYFVNPDFELILCLIKQENPPIARIKTVLEKTYDIENYCKSEKQLKKIMTQIEKEDLKKLIDKLETISKNDTDNKSSNYVDLFKEVFIID